MTKANKIISSLAAIALIVMAGCEWGTPSSGETWTMNGYDWFDFSGTFRGVDGGPIVSGFTYDDPTTEGVVTGEVISSASASVSGQTDMAPALPGLINPGDDWLPTVDGPANLIEGSVNIKLSDSCSLVDNGTGYFSIFSGSDIFIREYISSITLYPKCIRESIVSFFFPSSKAPIFSHAVYKYDKLRAISKA